MDLWIIYLGLVDKALKEATKEWLEGRQKVSVLVKLTVCQKKCRNALN